MESNWLKISEWKYRHASGDLTIEHDSNGWVITSPKAQRMWPVIFSNAEEAMEFADSLESVAS